MITFRVDTSELAERARPIYERLVARGNINALQNQGDPADHSVIERWCRVTTQGDWQTFEKRLHWDGIDIPQASSILQQSTPATSAPAWSTTLEELLEAAICHSDGDQTYRFLKQERRVPFEDVLIPMVLYARAQVAARTASDYDIFTSDAHAIAERSLLANLAGMYARTLIAEFTAFRALRVAAGNEVYREFVSLLRSQLPAFFNEYSVLARLTATVVGSWIDATSELIERVAADHEIIRAGFDVPDELGRVVSLVPDLSDAHNGRRFVVALTFANGFKVVYKPRDLRLELAFQQLLGWMNARGLEPAMRTLRVIARGHYGWVEFVEQTPCQPGEMGRTYYTRMGTLLCLGYAFEGCDLHHENIMTSGAHPVVVDAETFFYPQPRRVTPLTAGTQALTIARQQVRESVLKTGMLPETRVAADGVCFDVSALGSTAQVLPGKVMKWSNVNTDLMQYEFRPFMSPTNDRLPASTDYIDDLVRGFEQTYRFLLTNRDDLLADDGPVAGFVGLPIRFMIRPTRIYGVLLQNGFQPRYLKSGIDRSIALDALSVGFLRNSEQPYIWPAVQAEHRALEQLDVPRFTTTTDGTWLETSPHERIQNCFGESGYVRARARLGQLDSEDLYRQISFIRGAFLGRHGNGHTAVTAVKGGPDVVADAGELTPDLALQDCRKIAALLDSLAIRSDDGSASWVGLCAVLQTRQATVRLLDMGLHDGVCGVALFLAAYARISGETQYRDLARAAITPLQFTLRDPQLRERACKRIGIGGGFGAGSLIYSLVVAARLLDDSELIEDARNAAAFLTPQQIEEDSALDILMGSAGALIGLLKLYEVTGETAVLEQARTCGRHILLRQIRSGETRGGWPGLDVRPLSSFSHGAAGIAYALTRLHQITAEDAHLQAAHAALAFEQTLFVREAGNWARSDAAEDRAAGALRATWCQGAPGIALSRLHLLSVSTAEQIRMDLDVALRTTAAHAVDNVDHLCCGNLGRANILCSAGERLARSDLQQVALRNAGKVVARANRVGAWAIDEQGGPYRHGFFQGRAGIGYTLLRLTQPEALPDVLAWE